MNKPSFSTRNKTGSLELRISSRNNRIDLTLARLGKPAVQLTQPLARVFQVSTSRPWNFAPAEFSKIGFRPGPGTLRMEAEGRLFRLVVEFGFQGELCRLKTSWRYLGRNPARYAAVAVVLEPGTAGAEERVTMPHILYNGNPSSDPKRLVPRFGQQTGDLLICEESRFPIPCVQVEWRNGAKPRFLSLYSIPASDPGEWSLGCGRRDGSVQLVGASGVVALNGEKDTTYGAQCRAIPWKGGYRRMRPGDTIEKDYLIELGCPGTFGQAFRSIPRTGLTVFAPRARPVLSTDRVISLKTNALLHRWHENKDSSGFLCVPKKNIYGRKPCYLYGWSGQSIRLAWCCVNLGIERSDRELLNKGLRAVDFYVKGSGTEISGLRFSHYHFREGRWGAFGESNPISSRALGEAVSGLAGVIDLLESGHKRAPDGWKEAVIGTAEFLLRKRFRSERNLFPRLWTPTGKPISSPACAAGMTCINVLCDAYRYTNRPRYIEEAAALFSRYWRQCGDHFERPFAGSTLDADCEDKEAGVYAFLAAREIHRLTGEQRFRNYASVAADWILTFVYYWNTGFRPGTPCAQHGFVTTGWPGVSVQNHHLDVFFPAYELYDFGFLIKEPLYQKMGRNVFEAWSHGICPVPGDWQQDIPGEQGEQFFQTNFWQGPFNREAWRGGFNRWNPSWIIALVLQAALRFRYDTQAGKV